MTTFTKQLDQASVDLKRRDVWRLTLDSELQMNTMQIEQMQQTVSHPAVAAGIAGELQQFIARRGWEIGYAATSGLVKRWDSFREWVEDSSDNGGLNTTVTKVLPYVCQVEVKANAVQHQAIKSLVSALDPVDRLAIRPDALRIAEVTGDDEILDLIHEETKLGHGQRGPKRGVERTPFSAKFHSNTKAGARQQLRAYAADPDRCKRYGKDHALCQEAWVKVEQGEMSVNEGRIYCGLQKRGPSRQLYITNDTKQIAERLTAAMTKQRIRELVDCLTDLVKDD